jgi:biopolymer transport protein ExbD
MQFPRKARRSPTLNIIPLIDVLVVLLIFYIATTVFKKSQPSVKIQIPSSTQAKTTQETPPSIVYLTADGKFFIDNAPVESENLGELLKSKKTANPDFKLAVRADTNTPLGMFVKVYDAANFAGITDLQMFMNPIKPAGDPGP